MLTVVSILHTIYNHFVQHTIYQYIIEIVESVVHVKYSKINYTILGTNSVQMDSIFVSIHLGENVSLLVCKIVGSCSF